jgi:hypothetical protein
VQHVLPSQDGAAERRLSERVAGALAVRDVEARRPLLEVHARPFHDHADPHVRRL